MGVVFDKEALMENLDNDMDIVREIIGAYQKDAPQVLTELEAAL